MGQKRGMVKLFGKTIEVEEGDGEEEYKMPSSDAQGRYRESTGSEERGRRRGDDDRSSSLSTAKPLKPDDNVREKARDGDDVDSKNRSLKKPDKILPCPRCNSEDTKFCYFNNYNVNQPRYFCRNCQRYWTAGGSMRNVPVGAGRRKNKSGASAINYRHISVTSSTPTCQRSSSKSSPVQPVKPNQAHGVSGGSVMSFGDGRNIIDGDEKLCGSSSVTASNSVEDGIGVQGFGYPIGGTPWIYPWNNNQTPPSNPLAITLFPATPPPPPHLGFVVHNSLNPQQQQQQPWLIPSQFSPLKSLNTMKIEDPSEAANSFAWLRMGEERCKDNGFRKEGALFKPIKPKEKGSDLLHPNPAALSRSLCFHESTWQ